MVEATASAEVHLFFWKKRPDALQIPYGRLIVAEKGRAFGDSNARRGRICGFVSRENVDATAIQNGFLRAFGPTARILTSKEVSIVQDSDPKELDAQQLVRDPTRYLSSIEGSFAVAWRSDGALHLARDPLGHRTLYYATLPNGGFAFASTIAALIQAGLVDRIIEPRGLGAYLSTAYVPGQVTLVRGVFEVLAGEIVSYSENEGLRRAPFWQLPSEPVRYEREEALKNRLRSDLEEVIRQRLPEAGSPVGATLSGGIDSSLVVALTAKLHSGPLRTYSVSFGKNHRNELPFSTLVAEHCRSEHRVVELSAEVVAHHLDDAIGQLAEPNGDPLTVPNAILFREASQEVRVVLNGEGGDPCFGGPKNVPMLLAELLGESGADLREEAHARARSYLRAHQKCFDDLQQLIEDDVFRRLDLEFLLEDVEGTLESDRWPSFIHRLMAMNVRWKGPHHILPKIDHLGGLFGVFGRSPLFSRRIVERAFEVPAELKLRGSVEKYLLKEAVRDVVPEAIVDRPKSGMMVPVESWFQNELLGVARERILDGLTPLGIFRRSQLESLLAPKGKGLRPRRGVKIWLLLTFEAWWRGLLPR